MPRQIAVIGPSQSNDETDKIAFEVGAEIARRGAVLVCGGLGGVMEASCRGAKEHGGTTIGILPGSSAIEANDFVDYAIATGMGEARNAIVVKSGEGVVAVGGAFGTLSEIALALKMGKPVVGVATWMISIPGLDSEFPRADRAEDAVRILFETLSSQLER